MIFDVCRLQSNVQHLPKNIIKDQRTHDFAANSTILYFPTFYGRINKFSMELLVNKKKQY